MASAFRDARERAEVGPLTVMRDAPGRKRPPRKEQFYIHGVDPLEATRLIREYGPKHWGLSVIEPVGADFDRAKAAYKHEGYRLLGRAPFFVRRQTESIEPPPVRVERVIRTCEAEAIAKAAGQRQIPPELLKDGDQPIRLYGAFADDKAIGWVQSRRAEKNIFWVANLYVVAAHRRKNIGESLMRQMLIDDRSFGGKFSGLLSTNAGAGLYRKLGYQEIGTMMFFSPVKVRR